MDRQIEDARQEPTSSDRYERPTFQVISLDCEITAYAPDDDRPLF